MPVTDTIATEGRREAARVPAVPWLARPPRRRMTPPSVRRDLSRRAERMEGPGREPLSPL
eukprot:scaffold2261_cov405-Prasinococcus_capsulatus_cf.AAC.37